MLTGEAADVACELGATNGDSAEEALVSVDRARISARLPVAEAPRAGDPLLLEVDTERLHFFDPEDGSAL